MWFYADAETRQVLTADASFVLLYGGYEGFDNYGDILQLKGAIQFHRTVTGRRPILVLSMAAWSSRGLLDDVRSQFSVDGVIFEDAELLDVEELGLAVISDVMAGGLLHVYGGGYFNQFWGARRAFVCAQVVFRFHVAHYVVSGIQVDETGIEHLTSLFADKAPLLVAARDKKSHGLLSAIVPGDRLFFSFDDALEPIEELSSILKQFGGRESSQLQNFGLHMNITTEYMSDAQGARIQSVVEQTSARFPDHGITLLHAYNDHRDLIRDTLQSALQLDLFATRAHVDVLNFATMASMPKLAPNDIRRILAALHSVDFVISASYHISLTMNLLGKPTYLVSSNDYYSDKREALGLGGSLEDFLDDPRARLRDYASERRERRDWLVTLTEQVAEAFQYGWSERATLGNPSRSKIAGSAADRYIVR